jgi:hypothetical protein
MAFPYFKKIIAKLLTIKISALARLIAIEFQSQFDYTLDAIFFKAFFGKKMARITHL